jgi:enediyne biosynthesis protein E4
VYHNNGDGTFTDLVHRSGLSAHTQYLGWGILFADVDHDGRKDILVINGHVYPEIDKANLPARYRQPRLLYGNVGDGKFVDLSAESGPGIREMWSSRGAASGDLDNDGSLEIVINNSGSRPSLLKNFAAARNWLLVRAQGVKCNRDAVGARVYVYAGGPRLSGEVQTGSSFLSQNDPRLHFGLADAAAYDRIEIQWPHGYRERFPGGKANRIVTVKEGTGSTSER